MKNLEYVGKGVSVKIDRPIGSSHPKYPEIIYAVNYGFVPGTMSSDGEELDAYVFGVEEALEEFSGICIAVIEREDGDDKLIVASAGKDFSDEEIMAKTDFIERFFKSKIVR